MFHNLQIFQTVAAFALVVLVCLELKRRGIIKEEHNPIFAGILTKAAIPAAIVYHLALNRLSAKQVLMVAPIIIAVCLCVAAAWGAARLLRLDRALTGALMLSAGFSSSTLLGYPLVQYAFPGDPGAMVDAILISELGMGLPIFTLGVGIAMYWGETKPDPAAERQALWNYFRSPIFVALVVGLLLAPVGLDPADPWLAPFFSACRMIDAAIALLSCLILAVELRLDYDWRSLLGLLAVAALIKLGLQPWLGYGQAQIFGLTWQQSQVLILESAMPSAILGVVFATQYRCAASTTAALAFGTIILSLAAVPVVFTILAP
ncbi:MAG: AEC family transporter [Syntrophales bacterium]|nr:AEC family transporter [Syntrophales bacterium]